MNRILAIAIVALLVVLPVMAQNGLIVTDADRNKSISSLETKVTKLTNIATKNNIRVQALEEKVKWLENDLALERTRINELIKLKK